MLTASNLFSFLTARPFSFEDATRPGERIDAKVQNVSTQFVDERFLPIVDKDTGETLPPEIITPWEYLVSSTVRLDLVSDRLWPLFEQAVDANAKLAQALEPLRTPTGGRTADDQEKMRNSRYEAYKFQVSFQLCQFRRPDGSTFWGNANGREFAFTDIEDNTWIQVRLSPGPEGGVYVTNVYGVEESEMKRLSDLYYPKGEKQAESSNSTVAGTIGAGKAPVGKTPAEKSPQGSEVEQD